MYEHLFVKPNISLNNSKTIPTPTESRLRESSKDELSMQSNFGSLIQRASVPSISGSTHPGTSLSGISNISSSSFTNEYMLSQKLRNSGLYTKLKNKTMYARSEFVSNHSGLNSGIL